ncbi:254_t:CDS:2 [Paraglomus brasilianum]|uniref:254_t:CDS:1 n=1 Tax=Paraglomus brasilianum TaxID=144538 RepID=A0A9N9AJM4_9GLOM|nr:254_t:CDS:2 [Paraglomus brasilianum]
MSTREAQYTAFQLTPKTHPHLHHPAHSQIHQFNQQPTNQYTAHSTQLGPSPGTPPSPLTANQCIPQSNHSNITTSLSTMSTNTIPTSLPTPPTIPTSLTSNCQPTTATTPTAFDLHEVIAQFHQQPELLKLILSAKVEEDKRKAEEARLRMKEIEALQSRDRHRRTSSYVNDGSSDAKIEEHNGEIGYNTQAATLTYQSAFNGLTSPQIQNLSLDSAPPSSATGQETLEHGDSDLSSPQNKRKRKRREMLPVTMIIETKEYPYVDDYLWKNNGNTTQKKTGCKSVYYKCSNSNKGCPVNKTVTEKDGGWIIKYRGQHLEDCGKIRRIVQA